MIRMKVGVNNAALEELQTYLAMLERESLPNTAKAMKAGAEMVQGTWVELAKGFPMARKIIPSIQTEQTGRFEYEIFSEAREADWVENGTKRIDMKETHTKGPRSRVSKKGVPYLIVPFQWGTEEGTIRSGPRNIVPKQLLSLMLNKKFKPSAVKNGTYLSPNQRGQMVERRTYTWGDRAKETGDSFSEGMVRFEQGEKGKRHGGYFTFRVISAKSPKDSWIRKATPGRYVTKLVVQEVEREIEELVNDAIMGDFNI